MAPHTAKQITYPSNDTEQVQRALAREASAFRAIMQTHNQRLYRIARSILRNNADAEDAVQEAYVSAFTNLASYRGEGSLNVFGTHAPEAFNHRSRRWNISKARRRLFSFLSRHLTM